MQVTRKRKKAFIPVMIELENEKELTWLKAVAGAQVSSTQNEIADFAGIKRDDLCKFLLELYDGLENDC